MRAIMPSAGGGRAAAAVVAAALLGGCHNVARLACPPAPPPPAAGPSPVTVRFLGVGGFLIQRGRQAVLAAPLYSRPGIPTLAAGRLVADARRIEKDTEPIASDLARVTAILVGHSHYDHLLDVPILKATRTPAAAIYGNRTMVRILEAQRVPDAVSVEERALDYDGVVGPLDWTEIAPAGDPTRDEGPVRMLALRSRHSPQFLGYHLWPGGLDEPLRCPPEHACDWPEGRTLAFVLDFMGADGRVAFRVHYGDAPAPAPCGFIPRSDRRAVDLLVLCGGGAEGVPGYPDALLENACLAHPDPPGSNPILVGHWENFLRDFEPGSLPPGLDGAPHVIDRLKEQGWTRACLPRPGALFSYAVRTTEPPDCRRPPCPDGRCVCPAPELRP
jgi:glyoxylase-like metal-dependent hydrolase (beta-lactamase superfamily II)